LTIKEGGNYAKRTGIGLQQPDLYRRELKFIGLPVKERSRKTGRKVVEPINRIANHSVPEVKIVLSCCPALENTTSGDVEATGLSRKNM